MNVFGIVVFVTLIADYVLDLFAKLLNLGALRNEPPAELEDVYEADAYAKSQNYTRVVTPFGLLTSTFDLLLLLIIWFTSGFNSLDLWLRSFGFGPIVTGLLFFATLALGKTVLSLPFSLYSTFVIEEHFGFNRTTPRTFVIDFVKTMALTMVFGGPLLAAVLWFFERTGDAAWLWCWLLTSIFTLFLMFVFPVWIMPLFNKFEPLEEGELREALSSYSKSVGFALRDIFVIDGSRRSSRSNAFFAGFGRNKRIAFFDTLIEKHTVPELVAVLAHEVGHYAKGHIIKGVALTLFHNGVIFFLLSVALGFQGLFDAFYMDHVSIYAGLVFFALLYAPIELVLSLLLNFMSRKHEYEADRFAAETTGAPETMVSALKKLSADNSSNLTPHPFYVFLNYSHPPLRERVAAIYRASGE